MCLTGFWKSPLSTICQWLTVDCYSSLLLELQCTGLYAQLVTVKIGCIVHFSPAEWCQLMYLVYPSYHPELLNYSWIAITCSPKIFNAWSSLRTVMTDSLNQYVDLKLLYVCVCFLSFSFTCVCVFALPELQCFNVSWYVPLHLGPLFLVFLSWIIRHITTTITWLGGLATEWWGKLIIKISVGL